MKKILFIRPNLSVKKSSDAMQPLVFAILDALTPETYEKFFFDDCIENIDFTIKADIVALTVGTYAAKRAYEIARKFRDNGATILMGGFHISVMPDEAMLHADSVIIGDAEPVWNKVLSDFEKNRLQSRYISNYTGEFLYTKFNRRIFSGKKYFPVNLVQWGRGCKHNCDFCSIKSFYGNQCLHRPLNDVIDEIKTLDNKIIFFVDDNIYLNRKSFIEFLTLMVPLSKKWVCQVSIDVAWDIDLVRLMKKAGCAIALIGIETFNTSNLNQMNKSWNLSKTEYSEAINTFRQAGIMVYGTFIFGYDYDTPESFKPIVDFAIQNKLFLANFNPLYPMPGTKLYARLKAENRLEYEKWWLHPDFYYGKTMFKPLLMSPKALEVGCFNSKTRFNSFSSIIKRMLEFKANSASLRNLILYLSVNVINRREIYRKQNQKLGQLQ